ncbi:MAG: cbb3-type cytochrome oxidase assembly protein CcoS [Myxococcales bacterium]|nr:cbb3-type cytochrome oxidase assembly protein CcoS [Myxococcales bacterium]
MSVLYIVLPLAILIAIGAVAAFVWMVRGGQLDDLDSPALRILHDDAEVKARDDEAAKDNMTRLDKP